MILRPSDFWFDGACFKCAHYRNRYCQRHDTDIHGDCGQKCDDYQLAKDRWYSERVQRWQHDRGLDKPKQTTLEVFRWAST